MTAHLITRGSWPLGREVWLEEKGALDRERLGFRKDLWCVRDKVYDLSGYLSKHPGGADWLTMTRGHDVTDLVETHHLEQSKIEDILAKYLVGAVERPGNLGKDSTAFVWNPKGFYGTLRRRMAEALKGQGRGPTRQIQVVYALALLGFVLSLAAASITGSWAALVGATLCLHVLTGVGHNSLHQGHCAWRYCLDLTLFSHREWRVSHAISHHTYPNLGIDFELSALEPFLLSLAYDHPHRSATHPFLVPLIPVSLCILSLTDGLMRLLSVLSLRRPVYAENLLPLAELACLMAGQGWRYGLRRWLVMHALANLLLALVSLPLHHSGHSFADGGGLGRASRDFGVHTLQTAKDYATHLGPIPSLLFFQLFNSHTLHHLFPTVDESRLHALHPLLRQTCAEFNMPYRDYAWSDLAYTTLLTWVVGRERASRLQSKAKQP